MAQTATAQFRYRNSDFPILFQDGDVRVFKNPSNEIFVEDIRSDATMRINSYGHGEGLQFTAEGRVEPIQVNGMIGWRVSLR